MPHIREVRWKRHGRWRAMPLVSIGFRSYDNFMILISFPNTESKRLALSRLAGRFAFKSWATGEMLVPEDALPFLAVQGVTFVVEGPATFEQNGSAFRGAAAAAS